jgi:tetratricopeptide (TPR) repeat protein
MVSSARRAARRTFVAAAGGACAWLLSLSLIGPAGADVPPSEAALARSQAVLAGSVIELAGEQQRRGKWEQALALVEAALANVDAAEPKWRARLAATRGGLLVLQARRKGQWDRAITELEAAVVQGCTAQDSQALGTALDKLGLALHQRTLFTGKGDYTRAEQVLEEALQVRTAARAGTAVAETLFHLGLCAEHGGQPEKANERYRSALASAERAKDEEGIARAHRHLGSLKGEAKAWPQALHHYKEALAATRRAGDRMGLAPALSALADAMAAAGQGTHEPRRLLEEVLAHATELNDLAYVAHTRLALGRLAQTDAEREDAATHLREAMRAADTVKDSQVSQEARKRLADLGLPP